MPTILLTDRKIASLKPSGAQCDYFDRAFPGFGVRVNQQGRKTFILLYRADTTTADGAPVKRLRRLTLGTYGTDRPAIGLATARERAHEKLRDASVGRDPATERQAAKAQTFGALCERYIEKYAKVRKRSWRDDARMIRTELADWQARPAAGIRRADVRELLEGIVGRGAPVVANRVLALVRKVFNYGLDQEWIETNPAHKMARPAVEQSRTRVLTTEELRRVLEWLELVPDDLKETDDRRHWLLNRAVLRLRLITAQRGSEVIGMRWSDVDLEAGWWTIPASVSKNKLTHRVPLTTPAAAVLAGLYQRAPPTGDQVFKGIRGTRQRRGALDGLGLEDVRPHDFRRTAASVMASTGVPRLVIAKVLNHVEKGVTAVYDRHGYDAEKRTALETWARTLTAIQTEKPAAKVVPMRKRGR